MSASSTWAAQVELRVVDSYGWPVPFRAHVRTSANDPYSGYPDPILLSHSACSGYFYSEGSVVMDLPLGQTLITVGRGFEWRPVQIQPDVQGDTTLVVELERLFDLRLEGWYCGDVHVHTRHAPRTYDIGPEEMHFVARCEGLDQVWCLDQEFEFTGGPHAISTPEATLYYTTEYRNQACGHVALMGLKEIIGIECCAPPERRPTRC